MNFRYIIIVGLFSIIELYGVPPISAEITTDTNQNTGITSLFEDGENPYADFRDGALSVTPEKLKLKLDSNKTIVYGVVIDWDLKKGVATIVAYETGDASLYLSGGQLFIGGYAHEDIKNTGLALVDEAQNYLLKAKFTETAPLPDDGCIRFYLLTNKGKYFFQETEANITNNTSEWSELFSLGNKIITLYRNLKDNDKKK